VLEIGDDGVGFNPSQANHTGGLGLRGIVERVAQLDGIFAVRSTPGAGTTLRVEVEV
jgi:signal transduction histidine kinase